MWPSRQRPIHPIPPTPVIPAPPPPPSFPRKRESRVAARGGAPSLTPCATATPAHTPPQSRRASDRQRPVPSVSCQDSIYVLFLRASPAHEGGQGGATPYATGPMWAVLLRRRAAHGPWRPRTLPPHTPAAPATHPRSQPSPHMAVAPATGRESRVTARRRGPPHTTDPITLDETRTNATLPTLPHMAVVPASAQRPVPPVSCQGSIYVLFLQASAAHEGGQGGGMPWQPVQWWRRTGRQRAVAGEGTPGETATGERRRGRRYGADVPSLTGPDLVLTMWGASCPDGGAVADGRRRASGARRLGRRRSDVVPGPYEAGSAADSHLSVERPPVHADPLPCNTPPTSLSREERESTGWGVRCPPLMCDPNPLPPPTLPPQSRRAATASDPGLQPAHQHTPTTASQRRPVNRKINPPFSRRTRFKNRRKK